MGAYLRAVLLLVGAAWILSSAAAQAMQSKKTKKPVPPPVVVVAPSPSPVERYGQWTVQDGIANTENESGAVFGVTCSKTCVAFFNPTIACTDKQTYPALINSSAGAYGINLQCVVLDGRNLLSMPLTSTLIDSMDIGGELGIAFPMQSGKFQVSRFSLTGAYRAASRALEMTGGDPAKGGSSDLRNYTL